jgi:tRNA A-37 threonylcarbamoyl transferase component Bud32
MTVGREALPAHDLPKQIGRYRVVELIGRGAMGVVYAVQDDTMGRRAAVKVITAGLQGDPQIHERFQREARITGQLAHRNIVTVFDLGEDHGCPYMVMELLEGRSLPSFMRTPESEPLATKIDLMMQLCEGLQVAHTHGVVHRDIKPNNLYVLPDGTLKIMDFGVARLASSNLTPSSLLVGTLEFMSPEQAQARPIDARSDVFGAGCVFYYMLKGRAPFSSSDLREMLHAVVHEDPPPLTDQEAPEALRRVLSKAIAKAPADRYQQAADMLADLDRVQRTQDATTQRIVAAALERYRQIVATVEQRRALGRAVGVPNIEESCNEALARLAGRFPIFAENADPSALAVPMDRAVANDVLAALQVRHNAELASLEALRVDAADALKSLPREALDPLFQGEAGRRGPDAAVPPAPQPASRMSLKERAAAIWRLLTQA